MSLLFKVPKPTLRPVLRFFPVLLSTCFVPIILFGCKPQQLYYTAIAKARVQKNLSVTKKSLLAWNEELFFILCYLGMFRPCAIIPLSLRCRSSLSRVSRISLSTAVSGSSSGLRYDKSSRPESSEVGDRVEDRGGSLETGGWISLWQDRKNQHELRLTHTKRHKFSFNLTAVLCKF